MYILHFLLFVIKKNRIERAHYACPGVLLPLLELRHLCFACLDLTILFRAFAKANLPSQDPSKIA